MMTQNLFLYPETQTEILMRRQKGIQHPKSQKEFMKMMMTMMAFLGQLFLLDLKNRMILQRGVRSVQKEANYRPIIGPALPPGFRKPSEDTKSSRCFIGPSVSSECCPQVTDSSEEEDNLIGPMPAKGPVESGVTEEFERRAQRMKEKLTSADSDEPKQVTRESWMTELPPELKSFGFGPRTFKRRADDKSGDRSVWTDTPADRERKAKEREETKKSASKDNEEMVLSGRDKRLIEQVTSYNESKRSESLMDIHQKKLKTKASEEKTKAQERRPFDRDQDLKVNRFDEAQKKALIRKSRDLNTKFEHSKGNMFL
ncbi:GPALPP motifs-containing protein 1 isoform X2 [Pithys albifrons albifrons]|uniref:GPALPP motifs-containing protein 1 isoform X2 n=1 Tax=Pithys albifrons albifrons TaxID=3385563 RepID=UPI003A5CE84D